MVASRLSIRGVAGAISVVLCAAFAGSATAARPGGPCSKHSVSAVNQYCEDIPSPKGPSTPSVGTPAIGSPAGRALIAPRVLRALQAKSGRVPRRLRRKLLALPAATKSHPIRTPVNEANVPSTSITVILILILIAVALLLAALRRWHRRRLS
jgi:hypothetical protein